MDGTTLHGLCGCCGRRFIEATRYRPRWGASWTGTLAPFRDEGVCPGCYRLHGLAEGGEVPWPEDEWIARREERLRRVRERHDAAFCMGGACTDESIDTLRELGDTLWAFGLLAECVETRGYVVSLHFLRPDREPSLLLEAWIDLSLALAADGQFGEALRLRRQALARQRRVLAPGDLSRFGGEVLAAWLAGRAGRPRVARRQAERLGRLAAGHPDRDLREMLVSDAVMLLADACRSPEEWEDAQQLLSCFVADLDGAADLLREVLEVREEEFGEFDPVTAATRLSLAKVRQHQGAIDEAVHLATRAHAAWLRMEAPGGFRTRIAAGFLARWKGVAMP